MKFASESREQRGSIKNFFVWKFHDIGFRRLFSANPLSKSPVSVQEKVRQKRQIELDTKIKQLSDVKEEEISIAEFTAKKIERTLDLVKNPALVWNVGS